MPSLSTRVFGALLLITGLASFATAETRFVHEFERQQLSDVFYSEGATLGDVSGDGIPDVVSGAELYIGPQLVEKRALYPPKPNSTNGY
ncbi:MAG: hypothetical protein AAF517_21125 [Planctomycetota bacterium]